jgi:hypothetical protein
MMMLPMYDFLKNQKFFELTNSFLISFDLDGKEPPAFAEDPDLSLGE